MKPDFQQMNRTIDAFVEAHYYSEAHEFESARRGFVESLCDGMRAEYRQTVLARLQEDPSLVNVLLCAGGDIHGAGPWLAARLDQETSTSQLSRALIRVLAAYPGEDSYRAAERFLDSDQEAEALRTLARLQWDRCLPRLLAAAAKPELHPALLHIFHERRKAVGLPALVQEWCALAALHPGFDPRGLRSVLLGTPDPYNPFQPPEISALLEALRPA